MEPPGAGCLQLAAEFEDLAEAAPKAAPVAEPQEPELQREEQAAAVAVAAPEPEGAEIAAEPEQPATEQAAFAGEVGGCPARASHPSSRAASWRVRPHPG